MPESSLRHPASSPRALGPKAASPTAPRVNSSDAAVRSKSCPATPGKSRAEAAAPPPAKSSSKQAQPKKSAQEPAAVRRAKSSPAARHNEQAAADLAAGPSKPQDALPTPSPAKRRSDMPPPSSTPKRARVEAKPSPLKPRSLDKAFEAGWVVRFGGGGGGWWGEGGICCKMISVYNQIQGKYPV